ncbi:MAG: ADP-ribosylglycohydrolase family protein [Candidatus Riflebacteria bacterium]|nr:ADP-ribosylglycohydrolase family protein [Candidatus Riflebacteria bacterium]
MLAWTAMSWFALPGRRALPLLIAAVLALRGAAVAQDVPRLPAAVLAEKAVQLDYGTAGGPTVLAQLEGFALVPGQSLDLTLRTSQPTQLRLYLIPELGESRFRYVVLGKGQKELRLRLPYEAFDPDPQVARGQVPKGGALLILDVPGFMRRALANVLTVGPCRLATGPAELPDDQVPPPAESTRDPRFDRILGGWLGKAAGGRLGMPNEGKPGPFLEQLPALTKGLPRDSWGFGPDDDTSLAVLNLLELTRKKGRLEPGDLMAAWQARLATEYLWKTERRSLLELARGVPPLECGRGPLAGSICARIRADVWGLVSPGAPDHAVSLVMKDAPLSNSGDGAESARFIAVATSLAFSARAPRELLEKALERLGAPAGAHTRVLRRCLEAHRQGKKLEDARAELERSTFAPIAARDATNAWAYALPNDGLVALALLYWEGDFARSVALAAALGWDSDCNAATVGLLLGVMKGAAGIPGAFTEALHDRLRVAIPGREHWSILKLAHLTLQASKEGR